MPSAFGTDIREIPVADHGAGPYHITTGPDQALWLTLIHSGQVARLSPGGDLDSYQAGPPRPAVSYHHGPGRGAVVHPEPGGRDRPHHHRR